MYFRLHVYYYYLDDDDNNNTKNTSYKVIRINVLNNISEYAAFVRFNSVLSHMKLLFLGHSAPWNTLIKVSTDFTSNTWQHILYIHHGLSSYASITLTCFSGLSHFFSLAVSNVIHRCLLVEVADSSRTTGAVDLRVIGVE